MFFKYLVAIQRQVAIASQKQLVVPDQSLTRAAQIPICMIGQIDRGGHQSPLFPGSSNVRCFQAGMELSCTGYTPLSNGVGHLRNAQHEL